MKTEKILIYTDLHKQAELENSIESVQSGANELINLFENFQNYKKIKSLDDFETLVSDPLAMFDEALQTNVNFQESGGKKGNPEIIAKLFDIDRTSYQAIIKGEKIIEGTCKPCSKLKVKQIGKGVLSYATYQKFQEYLTFENGIFTVNEDLIAEKKLSFQVFAETPAQIECWNFWHNVCDVLNSLQEKNYCTDLHAFQTLLKNRVMFSYANNKLNIDETALIQEINSLKN